MIHKTLQQVHAQCSLVDSEMNSEQKSPGYFVCLVGRRGPRVGAHNSRMNIDETVVCTVVS